MVLFRGKDGQLQMDRRTAARSFVACEAELIVDEAVLPALLTDLSASGARLEMKAVPRHGAAARLRWDGHNYGCVIQWVTQDGCGLVFDEALPAEVLAPSSTAAGAPKKASRKRAPLTMGKKRSGSLANL